MRRMLGRWALLAIVLPLAAWAVGRIADAVENRRGEDSKVVKGLRVGKTVLNPRSA